MSSFGQAPHFSKLQLPPWPVGLNSVYITQLLQKFTKKMLSKDFVNYRAMKSEQA